MEGWRQERLGSRAGTHREKEKNKNILTGKERKKNILDTHRPSQELTKENDRVHRSSLESYNIDMRFQSRRWRTCPVTAAFIGISTLSVPKHTIALRTLVATA
jgi:hypothetical protein